MRLADLIPAGISASGGSVAGIGSVAGAGSGASGAQVEIASLAYDSRRVAPGALFFCVPGEHSDGHDFARRALAAGAAALVVERPLGLGAPEVVVRSTRAAMGPVAARFYGDPTAALRVVGVTGTNGKTTTAFLVRALLEASGQRCGLLGTVKSIVGGRERATAHTTPEAIDLQADFRAMLDEGEHACAMEVSSHALELGRVEGVRFAAAIFTNISRDHLDFHPGMEEYFQAKRRLFVGGHPPRVSVVNVGDPYGRRLAEEIDGAVTFAVDPGDRPAQAPVDVGAAARPSGRIAELAAYRATDVDCDTRGCRFTLHTPAGARAVALGLPGRFNVANALGALAAAHALGGGLDTLVGVLERRVRVPGRLEPVDEGQRFAVLVDYAHTPDSLENVLRAARELIDAGEPIDGGESIEAGERGRMALRPGGACARTGGRVVCVFGAGGDRDRGKRPLMGEVAARLAEIVMVTSDNPRSEDPDAIVAEILAGAARASRPAGASPVAAVIDRRAAIERAIAAARPGDVVVIAGKGHEQGQEFADGRRVAFDDVAVAREALRANGARAAGAAA
jgi:UDP-N-acetylmuramoyl-L-alanyl-D-glutamate--2,6-diaminopimelate ligase